MASPAITNIGLWVTETVPNEGDAGVHASLRLDSARRPNIAYWIDVESPQAKLILARKDGAIWTKDVVPSGRGAGAALAIDRLDRPWIAYYDLNASAMKVAHRETDGWKTDLVAGNLRGFAVGNTSIALSGDAPLVSFWSDAGLMVARRSLGVWSIETVDPNVRAGIFSSLAVAAQGSPHIAYFDLESESLRHAAHPGSTWVPDAAPVALDPAGVMGEHCSLAIDNVSGRLHIAYSSHDGLRHAQFENGVWQVAVVDPGAGVGLFPSVVVDLEGKPFIGYYDSVKGVAKVARNPAVPEVVTVDSAGDVGGYGSLVLDADGQGRIAYYDWARRALKFARLVAPPKAKIVRVQGGTTRLFKLDGSGSTGDALSFAWSVNATNVAAFKDGRDFVDVQFTGQPGDFKFTLTVTDAQQRQATDTIKVTIS